MKVGFIGLGTMGASMASNVQKGGHALIVHDVRAEAAKPHLAAGAVWAATPRQVAEASEVVLTSLPGPTEVEAVALGADGLLAGMSTGKAYFDLSTNSPTVMRRIHAAFAARGIPVLDAPVSGGPRGARTRKLAIWVGGDEATLQRMVLEEMTEALNRGWADRDSRSPMLLQEERAGVQVRADEAAIATVLENDPPAS